MKPTSPKPPGRFGLSLLANHFPALHGVRVLGILSVIQIHITFELGVRGWLRIDSQLYNLSQHTWFGMDLFFFLSGFLIGTILLLPGADGASGTLRFYGRRSFRIIPLYYVVLTLLVFYKQPLDALQKSQLWREYLYLTNYSDVKHVVMVWAWSLCVEEHFYILVPLLMALVKRVPSHRARIATLTALWLSGGLVRLALARTLDPSHPEEGFTNLYIPSHARYDILLAGVLLAYLWHTERARIERLMQKRWVSSLALGVSALVFGCLLFVPGTALAGMWGLLAIGTVTGVGYLVFVTYLITSQGLLTRCLGHRSFLTMATLGYGVYLVHMPLVLLIGMAGFLRFAFLYRLPVTLAVTLAVLLVFAVSLALAYVLHLVVEKPALWARDKLVPPKGAEPATTGGNPGSSSP